MSILAPSSSRRLLDESGTKLNLLGVHIADLASAALDIDSQNFELIQMAYFTLLSRENWHILSNYNKVKVPNRILFLPCGCHRDALNEGDRNSSWCLKKIHGKAAYTHRECGRIVLEYNGTQGGWIVPQDLLLQQL